MTEKTIKNIKFIATTEGEHRLHGNAIICGNEIEEIHYDSDALPELIEKFTNDPQVPDFLRKYKDQMLISVPRWGYTLHINPHVQKKGVNI